MLQDLQTSQFPQPPFPSAVAGSEIIPTVDEVLVDVVYGGVIADQQAAEEAQKIDQLRGYILERITGIQEMAALRKRHLAAAEKAQARLDQDHSLTRWDRQEIEGLMELDLARAEHCRAMVEHFKVCIRTFYAMLG